MRKNGEYLLSQWKKLSEEYDLNLEINQMPCICKFNFKKNNDLIKLLITKEMLKLGYLASNMVYISIYHNKKNTDLYIRALGKVIKNIKPILNDKNKIKRRLSNYSLKKNFKRLIN